jgi:ferredoxin
MRYTGAIKNLFGLVPGLSKSAYHLRFPDTADLGSAFVDLALVAAPAFSLMDAVVAMEGEGPMSGKPKQTGLLVASTDPLALDWIAASVIGYDPAELPYLADAALRGAWISGMQDIDLRGLRLDEARPASFELISSGGPGKSFADGLPRPLYRLARNLTVARPFFDHGKCVRCGGCIKICPPKALAYAPSEGARGGKRVEIDYEKCIRCYCCHEICPEDAIRLRKRVF